MDKVTNNNLLYILGPKNSGKTTSIELIIKELNSKGYKTGSIKFTHKELSSEISTKDTARVREAGSQYSIFLSPKETTLIMKRKNRDEIDKVLKYINKTNDMLPPVNILICESLNDPPENSKIVLVASTIEELESYSKGLNNPKILGISGKISNSDEKEWNSIPIKIGRAHV